MSEAKKRKQYEELDFTDDFMFCKILQSDKNLCKELTELILSNYDAYGKFNRIPERYGLSDMISLNFSLYYAKIILYTTVVKLYKKDEEE